jgi:hypothetical protein
MTDSEQQNPEPQTTTERWAYAGVRFTKARKTAEVWVDQAGDGEELWYIGSGTRLILGAIYDMEISRTDGRVIRHGDPQYTGDSIPWSDPRCRAWTTADNAARVRRQQVRDEAKQAKNDAIDQAIEALRPYAAACRNRAERDALLATVIRRITAMW